MKLQITIPTSLEEITLEKYQKFLSIAKDNPESDFLQHKMVEIFCGIDLKNAAKISYKDVNEITNDMYYFLLRVLLRPCLGLDLVLLPSTCIVAGIFFNLNSVIPVFFVEMVP